MRRILGKRTLRELRSHFLRYFALFLMIGFSMYLIVSLIGAADTIIIGAEEHAENNHVEDGQFTTFVPLTEKELDSLRSDGAEVEAMFYREYEVSDGSVLRVFKLREDIDLAELEEGDHPEGVSEVLLEKRYCEVNGISPGDTVGIAGKTYTVSGIATSPDYDAPFRSMGDSTVDSKNFGTAFVTAELYDSLSRAGGALQAEEYLYAYRLNGKLTDKELKEKLRDLRFDPDSVSDPYFREYWERYYGKRDDLLSGAEDLASGNMELSDALKDMEEELNSEDAAMLRMLLPEEIMDGVSEMSDAGTELADGSKELQDAIRELIDKYWKNENENLRSFVTAEDNPRIGGSSDDVVINRYASILAGFIILALLAYVISVFVVHNIEEERGVIGTLYALGVRRKELMRHYLVLSVLVSFAAGAVGTAIGYSSLGVPTQTADTYAYFSVPKIDTIVELWVVIYGVVMPPLIAGLVNWIVIRKKLSSPALEMIRGEEKRRDYSALDFGNMGYLRRFQLRQLLREGRSAAGVVFGIFVCFLLMMIGLNAYIMCAHVGQDNVTDTKYSYMYLYKYPEENVPDGGYPAYAESMKKEVLGYNMDVTILGLEDGNPFFDADPEKSLGNVQISSAMAQKYGLKPGDQFTVEDPESERYYAFSVDGVVTYSPAFYVFMDIDSMRELFGADDDYYNVVFSDRDLNIDRGRLYSVSTREDVEKASNIFVELMKSMVYAMTIVSTVIMAIVMYLMMKVMIDRSSNGIALFKVFGYRKRELRKFFLNGNTLLITLGALVSIPLSKKLMDMMYPYLVSNVACSIDLHFDPLLYLVLFAGVMLMYFLINTMLVRRIDRVELNEILKNRE